ncbi:MAG: GNAT family N-acetyltransferase [Candidatus Azobacteroides sp.]|nr:GNAT family N-acetyltransferase [Candidatus Azobacteroides sp.]
MDISFPVSEEITLSAISLADTADVFHGIDSNREALREWLPFIDPTEKEEDTRAFIEHCLSTPELTFVIRRNGEFAGLIGTRDTDLANHKTEIGYWLVEKYRGKGVITRSLKFLVTYLFGEREMNRIQIRAAVSNTKSRNIPEKLGFTFEGIEREGELLISGFANLAHYSMLKSDKAWQVF